MNDKEDVKNITTLINKEFEKWIKEKPEECLLFHRRWPNI
ncbi:LpxL/LpxP family acyltransferase [Candidatus Midichloria mitochondrii]